MATQTTQEFITARSKAILKEIKALRIELAAIRALKSSLSPSRYRPTDLQNKFVQRGNLTFQDMIVRALNDLPTGAADAIHILDLIEQKFGKKIKRSSISPQLSRLKSKGVLELNGNVWSLMSTYKKNEAP